MKLLSKERRGAKWVKLYEKLPCTPCQRIMDHPKTSEESKTRLRQLLAANDPLTLREEVEAKLGAFFQLRTRLEGERAAAADLVSAAPVSGAGASSSLRSPLAPAPPTSTALTKSAPSKKPPKHLTQKPAKIA